ncbi:hypothetical protein QMH89_004575 [Salmonella enterica]|nr:hypothetical protein [Salmonella enterica]
MGVQSLLIDKHVIFDVTKMTLTNGIKTIKISRAEQKLLLAFYSGIYKKQDIIDYVWEKRSGCVSESSYYKLINQMRNNFTIIGLSANDIITLPRIGVSLSLTLAQFSEESMEVCDKVRDMEYSKDIQQARMTDKKNKKKIFILSVATILLLTFTAILFHYTPAKNKYNSNFTKVGNKDGYIFFKMATDKVTFQEILSAYKTLTLPLCRQNGHYLYYLREPNMDLFLQCLNPVETMVPKCITIKERY